MTSTQSTPELPAYPDISAYPELPAYVDTNIYCGAYPFRALPAQDCAGLQRLLDEMRVESAFVTPFPSVFHTRPWAGLEPWIAGCRADSRVRFWAVVNPALPGWEDDLEAAAECETVVGIRLFPRCHGYGLTAPPLIELLAGAAERALPVCLTARLLDDRLYPRMMRVDPPLDLHEAGALLKQFPAIHWVLNGFTMPDFKFLKNTILAHPTALVDIGICKPFEPWWENLSAVLPPERLVLGSGAPLYYHAGTRLSLVRSDIQEEHRRMLYHENAGRLISLRKKGTTNAAV